MEENKNNITPEQTEKELVKAFLETIVKDAKNGRDITLRTGHALELHDPVSLDIVGVIDSPLRWLEKRKDIIDLKKCHIEVDRAKMAMMLEIDERNELGDMIQGKLTLSEEFKKFGINDGKYMTGLELSDLIRMNRSCFESKQKAMELVTIMRNFKATVTTQLESSDDKRGNRSALLRQVVEGNQPPSFDLVIPIFKGQPKQTFTVEIDIDPDTLQATLVSPDAQDIIAETRDHLIDEVLAQIEAACPEIPVIEI